MASITDIGIITTTAWGGTISAIDPAGVADEALENLDSFFVTANSKAPARCIDGRPNPNYDEAQLGAQVPGGTPGEAIARRLSGGRAADYAAESQLLVDAWLAQGFMPGGHRDDHNLSLPTTGCGAVDKSDLALQALVNPAMQPDLQRLVSALLGSNFDQSHFEAVLSEARSLEPEAAAWFATRSASVDYLEAKVPGSAPVLQGSHQEFFVIINTVPDTTFATDRFAQRYGIQAFGYDFWHTLRDELKVIPETDQAAFIMARAMTAVATLMVLTDGSQRLVVRSE